MTLHFSCCDDRRRAALLGHASLNGIDDLEVGDLDVNQLDAADAQLYQTLPPSRREVLRWQRRLTLTFVNPLTGAQKAALGNESIVIEGGTRVRDVRISVLDKGATTITLRTSVAGDFSRYRVRLVRSRSDPRPPSGFDPVLASIDFSFKVDCPTDFDCRAGHTCLRGAPDEPSHRLPGQGLRQLPPAHPRPDGPAGAGLAGTEPGRSGRGAGGGAGLCG